VWYMADGIYSMYGDYAPISDLEVLVKQYPCLQLYFDDVRGMSWTGRNGTGFVMNALERFTDSVVLFTTLSKSFGASGGVLVCPNKNLQQYVKTFGGPLTFSAQLEPASVAAAIASANIHLSDEIYSLQEDLRQRITYFNELVAKTDLPIVDANASPVFYIGTGMPETGYNFVNRLLKEGYYTNLGLFPAVPIKNTGVRITISRHNTIEDIKGLVDVMTYHYPQALEETYTTLERVCQAFKMDVPQFVSQPREQAATDEQQAFLGVSLETSILSVDK